MSTWRRELVALAAAATLAVVTRAWWVASRWDRRARVDLHRATQRAFWDDE